MIFYQSNFILGCVCFCAFYLMGKEEAKSGRRDNSLIWAGLSAAASGFVIGVVDGSWLTVLVANVLLFISIGLFRVLRDRK